MIVSGLAWLLSALKRAPIQIAAVSMQAFNRNRFPLKSTAARFEQQKQLGVFRSLWLSHPDNTDFQGWMEADSFEEYQKTGAKIR